MSLRRFIFAVLAGIVLTVVLGFIGVIMSGGGHYMTPLIIIFPYIMYPIFDTEVEKVPAYFGMFLFCIQFTVYAILLANARNKRQAFYISVVLIIIHTIAVIFSYSAYQASEKIGHLQNPVNNVSNGDFC